MGLWACSAGGSSVGRSVISLAPRSCSRGSGPEWAPQPESACAFFAAPIGLNGFLHRLPCGPRPLRPVRKHYADSPPSHPSAARAFTSPGVHLQQLRQAARPAPARCASGIPAAAPPRRRLKWLAKLFQLTRVRRRSARQPIRRCLGSPPGTRLGSGSRFQRKSVAIRLQMYLMPG